MAANGHNNHPVDQRRFLTESVNPHAITMSPAPGPDSLSLHIVEMKDKHFKTLCEDLTFH